MSVAISYLPSHVTMKVTDFSMVKNADMPKFIELHSGLSHFSSSRFHAAFFFFFLQFFQIIMYSFFLLIFNGGMIYTDLKIKI